MNKQITLKEKYIIERFSTLYQFQRLITLSNYIKANTSSHLIDKIHLIVRQKLGISFFPITKTTFVTFCNGKKWSGKVWKNFWKITRRWFLGN
jgi:hypothetical protein